MRIGKQLSRLFFVLGTISFSPTIAVACSCIASYSPWIADLSNSDAVFSGKVQYVKKLRYARKGSDDFIGDRLVTFEVEKPFKGISPSTKLISLYSDYNSTSCSFGVDDRDGPRVGEKWIVFANKTTNTPQMFFGGSCNSSMKIRSQEMLKVIEAEFYKFPQRQGILGSVVVNYLKLANDVEVTVAGEGVFQSSKVDAQGYFWLPLERPGIYTVSVKVPFHTTLFNAVKYPKTVDQTKSITTFVYDVHLMEGEFNYNELNVSEPR